jgi:D-alanyl-lipoteichoic acid acyltransferase DltB (MBOAT superfamily)
MLFNSYTFIFAFLPLSFLVYFYLNSKRLTEASKAFLVFASLFFYSWWNIIYLPLILSSLLFNYTTGKTLSKKYKIQKISKKSILIFGIIANLSLLGYFKYSDFFISNFNTLANLHINLLHLALPLAVSFFTFQQIAYLVDSYKNETKEYDFLNYSLFVTFFPQLIAGPIVHHKEMMPQFANMRNKTKNYKNIATGLFIFSIGLFKKVVIADTFALWATAGFDHSVSLTFFEAWATSLSYTFQLYFDFSGYTDMAIGAALLFNIKLPINFNSPYKARDIQDFWRRWHITLSRFLKDYIYIPLGGNRKGKFRTYYNIMVTFVLGGLWHGAGWTFVFWGTLHGVALVIHRLWKSFGFTMNKYLAWFITFNFVNIAWVFFRAKEWKDAVKVLWGMAGGSGVVLSDKVLYKLSFFRDFIASHPENFGRLQFGTSAFVWSIVGIFVVAKLQNSTEISKIFSPNPKSLLFISIITIYTMFDMNKISEFLYFNF